MQDKKPGLSHIMQEVQSIVCRRDEKCPARQDEWTPLRHQDEEDGKASHGPLLPGGPHHGRSGSEGDREDSQEQWRKERESYWIFTLRTLSPHGLNLDE